jgi:hypothetical protein
MVSRAILLPAQVLTSFVNTRDIPEDRLTSNVPAPKPEYATICRVRQIIVNEALWLELFRLYEDRLVVEYGPRKQREDRENLLQHPSITYHVFPSTDAPAGT